VAATVRTPIAGQPRKGPASLVVLIFLGIVTAVLLDFCFPVAGPMPRW
jgi:hypothetical protein